MVALFYTGINLSILKSVIAGEIEVMQSTTNLKFKERFSSLFSLHATNIQNHITSFLEIFYMKAKYNFVMCNL
jgi:hypothetical protein